MTGSHYDFGARIYDSRLGRWLSVDPLQEKYPGLSAYNFVANSPIVLIDPDGKKIKPNNADALQIIKYCVTPEEAKFIDLDNNGFIDLAKLSTGLSKIGNVSSNYSDLLTVVNDKRIVEVNLINDMELLGGDGALKTGSDVPLQFQEPASAKDDWTSLGGKPDKSGNIAMMGQAMTYKQFIANMCGGNEYLINGTTGKTLLPIGSKIYTNFDKQQVSKSKLADRAYSTNSNFQILLNKRLYGKSGYLTKQLVGTYSHEINGHLLFYFLQKSYLHGQDRVDKGNPNEYNKQLETKIKSTSIEAEDNYEKHRGN